MNERLQEIAARQDAINRFDVMNSIDSAQGSQVRKKLLTEAARADVPWLLARCAKLSEALTDLIDDESDLSTCPYFTRHLPGGDPEGTCGFGCYDEPQCMTCRPRDGWPRERARAALNDA